MYSSIALILGHFVGDYWFQSGKMAVYKSEKGREGRYYCDLHCFIYSICVALFVVFGGWTCNYLRNDLVSWEIITGNLSFAFLIAYITHYPIDRTSFASIWMKWMGSTQFNKIDGWCNSVSHEVTINKRNYFVAPVYIAIDNSMHLVLMWIFFSLLGK